MVKETFGEPVRRGLPSWSWDKTMRESSHKEDCCQVSERHSSASVSGIETDGGAFDS